MVISTSSGYSYVPASFSLIFTVSDIKSRTLGLPGDNEMLITRIWISRLSLSKFRNLKNMYVN